MHIIKIDGANDSNSADHIDKLMRMIAERMIEVAWGLKLFTNGEFNEVCRDLSACAPNGSEYVIKSHSNIIYVPDEYWRDIIKQNIQGYKDEIMHKFEDQFRELELTRGAYTRNYFTCSKCIVSVSEGSNTATKPGKTTATKTNIIDESSANFAWIPQWQNEYKFKQYERYSVSCDIWVDAYDLLNIPNTTILRNLRLQDFRNYHKVVYANNQFVFTPVPEWLLVINSTHSTLELFSYERYIDNFKKNGTVVFECSTLAEMDDKCKYTSNDTKSKQHAISKKSSDKCFYCNNNLKHISQYFSTSAWTSTCNVCEILIRKLSMSYGCAKQYMENLLWDVPRNELECEFRNWIDSIIKIKTSLNPPVVKIPLTIIAFQLDDWLFVDSIVDYLTSIISNETVYRGVCCGFYVPMEFDKKREERLPDIRGRIRETAKLIHEREII